MSKLDSRGLDQGIAGMTMIVWRPEHDRPIIDPVGALRGPAAG